MIDSSFFVALITGAFGTVGFALIFRLRPKHVPFATLGAVITYAVYYFLDLTPLAPLAVAFLASIVGALYSEICARLLRAPSIIFAWLCMIPIVPGASLYYTMSNLFAKDYDATFSYLSAALNISLGIAGGIIAVSIIFGLIRDQKHKKV